MATQSRTWNFANGGEGAAGLVEVGDSAPLAATWNASDGTGSWEWTDQTSAALSTQLERARAASQTWEALFPGLPAGSIVTDVQLTAWKYIRWGVGGIGAGGSTWKMRIVNGSGVSVHSAGDLLNQVEGNAAEVAFQTGQLTSAVSRAVDAGSQPSSSIARLELEIGYTRDAAATPSPDLEFDDITIQITYSAGAAAAPRQPLRSPGMRGPS